MRWYEATDRVELVINGALVLAAPLWGPLWLIGFVVGKVARRLLAPRRIR